MSDIVRRGFAVVSTVTKQSELIHDLKTSVAVHLYVCHIISSGGIGDWVEDGKEVAWYLEVLPSQP